MAVGHVEVCERQKADRPALIARDPEPTLGTVQRDMAIQACIDADPCRRNARQLRNACKARATGHVGQGHVGPANAHDMASCRVALSARNGSAVNLNIGISGATGVTGEVTLRILEERKFPVGTLRLFASRRSANQIIRWKGRDYPVEALEDGNFKGLDLVISATSAALAREWAPRMVEAGAIVIDQSSAFRLDPSVPLVVPEINAAISISHRGIIAGPNCTTAVAIMAVAPLHQAFGVDSRRQLVVSGDVRQGPRRHDGVPRRVGAEPSLKAKVCADINRSTSPAPVQFPHLSAFNVFPQCEEFRPGEDTSTEEEKMQAEMRKMLHAPNLAVHATAVRVPVLVGHTVSLAMSLDESREPAGRAPRIRVVSRRASARRTVVRKISRRRSRPRASTTCWSDAFAPFRF